METLATAMMTFSILGGFASSKVEVSNEAVSVTFDSRLGIVAGVGMTRQIGSTVSFAPELLYVQKGFEIEDDGVSAGLKISYVELPLLLRATFGGGSVQPYVTGGPVVAFKASCSVNAESEEVDISTDCDEFASEGDGDAEFKSIDYGVMIGGGIQHGRFTASIRYDLGLAGILSDDAEDTTTKNRALLFLLGVEF